MIYTDKHIKLEYQIMLYAELAFHREESYAKIPKHIIEDENTVPEVIKHLTKEGFTITSNDLDDYFTVYLPKGITVDYFRTN